MFGEYGGPSLRSTVRPESALLAIAISVLLALVFAISADHCIPGTPSGAAECVDSDQELAVSLQHDLTGDSAAASVPQSIMFVLLAVYFALLNQMSDAWVTQGTMLERSGFLPPDAMPTVNDVMDVVMLAALETRRGSRLRKVTGPGIRLRCGMLSLIPTYICTTALQLWAESVTHSERPSLLWQLPQYFFISVCDIFVMPAALELAHNGTSEGSNALAVSFVYLAQGLGNLVDGAIFALPLSLFWQFGVSLLVAALAVCLMHGSRFRLRRITP